MFGILSKVVFWANCFVKCFAANQYMLLDLFIKKCCHPYIPDDARTLIDENLKWRKFDSFSCIKFNLHLFFFVLGKECPVFKWQDFDRAPNMAGILMGNAQI